MLFKKALDQFRHDTRATAYSAGTSNSNVQISYIIEPETKRACSKQLLNCHPTVFCYSRIHTNLFHIIMRYTYIMRTHAFPGTLITLEGIDGAGKTQLLSALTTLLSRDGHTVIITKEPGGTRIGRMLKTVLLEEEKECDPRVEFLLFAADRAEHFQKLVIPALMRGDIIISDRMADSALAYQGYGRGVDTAFIDTVNTFAMHGISPDITLYLRIPLDEALKRRTIRGGEHSTMEQEGHQFWERVAAGYEEIARKHSRIYPLDGLNSPEVLAQDAYTLIVTHMQRRND